MQKNIASVSEFTSTGKNIVKIFQIIGNITAVAVLTYVGIKFMIAAPAEKAQLKGALIPYIVGAIIVFAAVNLATIIQQVAALI